MCWMCVIHDFGADSAPQPGDQPNLLVLKLLIIRLPPFFSHLQLSPSLSHSPPSVRFFLSSLFTSILSLFSHIHSLASSFFSQHSIASFLLTPTLVSLFSLTFCCLPHSKTYKHIVPFQLPPPFFHTFQFSLSFFSHTQLSPLFSHPHSFASISPFSHTFNLSPPFFSHLPLLPFFSPIS